MSADDSATLMYMLGFYSWIILLLVSHHILI